MQLTIAQIQAEMAEGELSPGRVSDFRVFLAALYSLRSTELQGILVQKPAIWLSIRDGKKSDRAADREWEATTKGIRETELNMELRRIDKMVQALSAKLRVMEGEARNQY